MGKVTLAVLVLAIALGVYWFWWSDQGANKPITVEGTLTVSGMPSLPGSPAASGPHKIDFTLQTVPNKVRISARIQGRTIAQIVRLDKRETYYVDEKSKKYAVEEFDLMDMDQTKLYEKGKETWPSEFTRTPDWEYVGRDEEKWFCNRQTLTGLPKDMTDAVKGAAAAGPAAAMFEAMFKNVKIEVWFTSETRVGRRHFRTLNKFIRVREVGSKVKEGEKRPQFEYVNLAFFPIPLRANVSLGQMKMELEVRRLSREKIAKDAFEVPAGFVKVSKQEIGAALKPPT